MTCSNSEQYAETRRNFHVFDADRRVGPLCVLLCESVLVAPRTAVLGARSAPEDAVNQPRGAVAISEGAWPRGWLQVTITLNGERFELDSPMSVAALLMQLDIDLSTQVNALTDGLLILRYLFGFRGPVLTNGAVDLMTRT